MTRGIAMQTLASGGAGGENEGRPTAEDGLGEDTLRVFYGNDTYYVLFRLHQYLYDRCGAAQSASNEGFAWKPGPVLYLISCATACVRNVQFVYRPKVMLALTVI